MALLADSEAQFTLRVDQCGVPAGIVAGLRAQGISTISAYAYSYGQPGQPIDNTEFGRWIRQFDPAATIGGVAAAKRLLFESQTQLLALIKEQITSPDSASLRKVPQAEREARLASLRARLTGVVIEAHTEPSHALLDAASHMRESDQFRYLPPEKCTSRMQELTSSKDKPKVLEVEASKLIVKERSDELEVATSSALQVMDALKRRGLALDFGQCMSYTSHDKYLQTLFSHLHRDPPQGYNRCSVSQLVAADKAAWAKVIERNVKPRRNAHGQLPLDTELLSALQSYEVSFTLIPLPAKARPEPKKTQPWSYQDRESPYGKGRKGEKGKPSKGTSKGKGKTGTESRIPAAIRTGGGTSHTPAGLRICYDYSLSACAHAADGAECPKGVHVCAKCFGPHPFKDHDKH